MSYPVFILSDASLEQANNTPEQMVAQAKKQGFNSVCLVDINSMSATIRFAKACLKHEVSPLFGVTLTVSCPIRDNALWLIQNRKALSSLKLYFNENMHPYEHVKAMMVELASARQGKGDKKYKALLEKHLTPDSFNEWSAKSKGASLNAALKSVSSPAQMGQVVFVAKEEKSYSKVLSLASWHAKVKRENVKNDQGLPEALTAEALSTCVGDDGGVMVLDFWSRDGFSFPLYSEDDHGGVDALNKSAFFSCIDALGYTEPEKIPDLGKRRVIMPYANYTDESEYDAFVIKKAAHLKENIYAPSFIPPDSKLWLMPKGVYESLAVTPKEDASFYSDIVPFPLTLGEVHLPSYDMPVKDVVAYAFEKEGVAGFGELDTEQEAIKAFEEWLSPTLPESMDMTKYRNGRLNAYCLHRLGMRGLDERLKERFGSRADDYRQQYVERFESEFEVMDSMGFAGYFLIEFEFIDFAHSNGIPIGPGRGSAPGSLVVYALRLTDIDPIEYGLQFERFLNEERVSMPDIDTDVGEAHGKGRADIIAHINKRYQQPGSIWPSSSQIANISRFGLKKAISAVRRTMGLSMRYETYELKKLVEAAEAETGANNIDWEDFNSAKCVRERRVVEPLLDMLLRYAESLTGKMETYGVHAGGVVISPTVMTDFSALTCDADGNYVSQFDKDDIESAGLIKFDILGLRTLSINAACIAQIEHLNKTPPDLRTIPVNDMKTYELIGQLLLCDIFQLEGEGMSKLVANLQPQTIEEIAILSALYRPGPLQSGMVESYVDASTGITDPSYDHPALKPVLEETKGCIVYQEQVMSIVRVLAGYTLGQADLLRRAMGKKKAAEMIAQGSTFTSSALHHWREHFKDVGVKQNFSFTLDVVLDDIKAELDTLGVASLMDERGVFSNRDNVVEAISVLLGLGEGERQRLSERLADFKYVLRYFKDHYQDAIYTAINQSDIAEERKEEVSTRLYFSLSQYVRFNQIFNKVAFFAGYGFNKSHAAVYALDTYHQAYLKAHYTSAFYAAALSARKLETLGGTINEAVGRMGINVKPPSINHSNGIFMAVDEKSVRYGLTKLKGVGDPIYAAIKEREENGPFADIIEFIHRLKQKGGMLNITAMTSLIKAGAFDGLLPKRIVENKNWNGRSYHLFLCENFLNIGYSDNELSPLHAQVDSMSEFEFYCYLSACVKSDYLVSNVLAMSESSSGDDVKSLLKNKPAQKQKEALLEKLKNSEVLSNPDFASSWMTQKNTVDDITDFEFRYLRIFFLFQDASTDMYLWENHLNDILAKPVAQSLMEEREVAGAFITANPLKVLKIRERVEREPPGSLIDGRPVDPGVIDDSYHWQSVTTYGVVSGMDTFTVSKEGSKAYGEQILKFNLESHTESVSCSIFGTNAVKKFKDILDEGMVVMVAGKVKVHESYGVGVNVSVVKRYFPDFNDGEDDKYHVV